MIVLCICGKKFEVEGRTEALPTHSDEEGISCEGSGCVGVSEIPETSESNLEQDGMMHAGSYLVSGYCSRCGWGGHQHGCYSYAEENEALQPTQPQINDACDDASSKLQEMHDHESGECHSIITTM
jgi:hypothetical protein